MKNLIKRTRKSIFAACIFSIGALLVSSCENETFISVEEVNEIKTGVNEKYLTRSGNGEIIPFITNLMAGQHHVAGTLAVNSDGTNLLVTYKVNCNTNDTEGGSWTLKATHLFVGNCDDMPVTKKGNPKIGKFPYKTEHGEGVNEYTYTIPLSDIDDCFCLAAHAEVDCGECDEVEDDEDEEDGDTRDSEDTNYCGEETAWALGDGFPGRSWAMFNELCIDIETDEDEDDEDDESGDE